MKIVDAHTGAIVRVGERIPEHRGWILREVREGVFSASALVQTPDGLKTFPLIVRYTHPGFFLQKVAFIPS